ncbi:LANO_0G13366g1_1 [Lachancea nothofagi CBS 11611]|uniref:LANO_0G13366g1_1 n=1 Tax=Lachancea nothofagi CBS 11611 TaxID=1266666 RepID=A0A1G4KJX7_9SACH|nr:LANO_0G13366g1_1 [Lachancea nothofagi CBS 11611]
MVVERKVRCKVQEFVNDKDFVHLKRSVHRKPQIIRQKLSAGTPVQDPVFDEVNRDFKELKCLVKVLLLNCDKYSTGIRCFVERSLALSSQFEYVLNNSRKWTAARSLRSPAAMSTTVAMATGAAINNILSEGPLSSPLEPFTIGSSESDAVEFVSKHDIGRFRSRQEAVRGRIEANLKFVDESLRQPLVKLTQLCLKIECILKERDFCIVDLKSYTEKYNKSNAKKRKKMPPRQARNKMRYARDLELEKLKYESLTATIKIELQVLFKLFGRFLAQWGASFILTSYSIAFTLYSNLGCHNEVMKMMDGADEFLSSSGIDETNLIAAASATPMELPQKPTGIVHKGLLSLPETVAKFHAEFDHVTVHMRGFQVTKFDRLYHATLSSAKESAKVHFRDSAVHGTIPTLYATALYNYTSSDEGHNLGDLSFHRSDVIKVVKKSDPGWWYGEAIRTKQRGYFPANYVEADKFL